MSHTESHSTDERHIVARISGVGVEYVIDTDDSVTFDVVAYCGPIVNRYSFPDFLSAMTQVGRAVQEQLDDEMTS